MPAGSPRQKGRYRVDSCRADYGSRAGRRLVSVYSVYEPPGVAVSKAERADQLIFVRDTFSRPTLVFGPMWLLIKGQWAGLLAYALLAALTIGICVVAGVPSAVWGYFYLGLNLIFALEYPLMRGTALEAEGWQFVGVSEGRTDEEAEYRFLASWLENAEPSDGKTQSVTPQPIDLPKSEHEKISPVLREARPPRILN